MSTTIPNKIQTKKASKGLKSLVEFINVAMRKAQQDILYIFWRIMENQILHYKLGELRDFLRRTHTPHKNAHHNRTMRKRNKKCFFSSLCLEAKNIIQRAALYCYQMLSFFEMFFLPVREKKTKTKISLRVKFFFHFVKLVIII